MCAGLSSAIELPWRTGGQEVPCLQAFSMVASFSSRREMEGEGRRRTYIKPGILWPLPAAVKRCFL